MTDNAPPGNSVTEPFPIFLVANRYMLYDVDVVSHIRRVYHMCGCLIGTLPQVPQQNVFLGLPLELMVEEATLLVKKGVAYIVDDVHSHKLGRATMLEQDKQTYLAQRDDKLRALAEENQREALVRKMAALEKKGLSNLITRSGTPSSTREHIAVPVVEGDKYGETAHQETLFPQLNSSKKQSEETQITFHSTSTTSNPVYHHIPKGPDTFLRIPTPNPNRFPIYQHLHSKGYFISPGIRFGAQYVAYPGDPLRFHSHFVVNGLGWDEEISVMDIVGGGRLGTGVKKAWMVGGKDPTRKEGDEGYGVRVFSVEWGGF